MSFKETEEQSGLRESLKKLLSAKVNSDYLRSRLSDPKTTDPNLWKSLSELGLSAYFCSAEYEPKFRDLAIIAYECGYGLLPEALPDALLSGPFLLGLKHSEKDHKSISKEVGEDFFEKLSEDIVRVVSYLPLEAEASALKVSRDNNSLKLSGDIQAVEGLGEKSYLLVQLADDLVALSKEPAIQSAKSSAANLSLDLLRPFTSLGFKDSEFIALADLDLKLFKSMRRILAANELAGICARVVAMTVDYVSQRKQFDVPVGGFQAVQHGMAEMHVHTECLRSLAEFAAWSLENSPEQAEFSAAAALEYARDYAPLVIEKSIQLHGGIGFTWEYDLHLYLRRARTLCALHAGEVTDDKILQMALSL